MASNKWSAATAFCIGAGIGAAVAVIVAPKSGEEVREEFGDVVDSGVQRSKAAGRKVANRAHKAAAHAKDQVRDALDAGQREYDKVRNS